MRPIKFTPQEVVDRIKELKVVKIEHLAEYFRCSIRTLFNKLERNMYYTSYNLNGQYITLKETPTFDENGIWEYRQVRFSKWRNVEETIHHIADKSSEGITPNEIAENLQIRTHNQLLSCRQKGLLVSKQYGRNQVYYSINEETQKHQMEKRESRMIKLLTQIKPKPVSNKMIIDVLITIIKHHETKPKNIASILSSEGKRISERSVMWVIEKYEIKKKAFPSES